VGQENSSFVHEAIKNSSSVGYEVVGTISDDPPADGTYLGRVEAAADIVRDRDIDILLMTFPLHSKAKASRIIERCRDLKVDFLFVPDLFEMVTTRVDFYELNGIPLIRLIRDPVTETYKVFKRIVDATLASILLLVSLPLSVSTAILIRLTSRGPIIYKQKRVGKNGKLFTLLKFRTMSVEAEKHTGPVWAVKNDPRVTWIGGKLRATRVDELPQLINILMGHMSIIGPRPERPYFVDQLKDKVPNYTERLKVKPGLTGLAQVNHRYDISLDDVKIKLEYDLMYINKISLPLDTKILFKTVGVMLNRTGAH
jgi:exopolysaccharide biosynthesis polyprenyl glycosylphosphotransferase